MALIKRLKPNESIVLTGGHKITNHSSVSIRLNVERSTDNEVQNVPKNGQPDADNRTE